MIKGILFALFFVLLFVAIGLIILFSIKNYKEEEDYQRGLESITHDKYGYSKQYDPKDVEAYKKSFRRKYKGGLIGAIVASFAMLGLVITIPGSFHQVEAGTYAVVKKIGKIVEVRSPGTYFDFYMTKKYEVYDATVQQVKINTSAYSHDAQTMDLEVYLQYQIQLDKLVLKDTTGGILQTEGIAGKYVTLDSLQARIETQTIEKTKAVMSAEHFYDPYIYEGEEDYTDSVGHLVKKGDYIDIAGNWSPTPRYPDGDFAMTGENIIRHRADVSNKVSEVVRAAIGDDYYVIVQDVVLTNIDFTDEFEKSVENKVIEEQNKIAAETKANAEKEVAIIQAEAEKAVAEIEAQKKVIEAEADAEVIRIAAQAQAKAVVAKIVELAYTVGYTVTETETGYIIDTTSGPGAAEFKKLVEDYLQYLAYLEQWNGELPQVVAGDDAISIIVPNN